MIADAPAQLCADSTSENQYPRMVHDDHVRLSRGVTSESTLLQLFSSAKVMGCLSRIQPSELFLELMFCFARPVRARRWSMLERFERTWICRSHILRRN